MEINIDATIEELQLSTKTNKRLYQLGIMTVDEMLNYNIEELSEFGVFGEDSLDELDCCYWKVIRREIMIIDPELERRKEVQEEKNERYFRHVDGIRYEDVPLGLVIWDRKIILELHRVGLYWLSQIIGYTTKMYRERLDLDFNQIWDIQRWLYEWKREIAPGVDKDTPPSGEHLFYSAIGCFQELFNYMPDDHSNIMAICNKHYQSQGEGYDVSKCLDDQELGLALLASMSFGYELDQKIPTKIDIRYGSTFEELEAGLPGMFQGEKVIRAILAKDLKSQWISEVVTGHFARGRLGFELSGNDNYDGLSNDDEMFYRMLANQKPV